MARNRVDLFRRSGKVRVVATRPAAAAAAGAAAITRGTRLGSGGGLPDVPAVDQDPEFTSTSDPELCRASFSSKGSSLVVGSAFRGSACRKAPRSLRGSACRAVPSQGLGVPQEHRPQGAQGAAEPSGDKPRALATGRKDDSDGDAHLCSPSWPA